MLQMQVNRSVIQTTEMLTEADQPLKTDEARLEIERLALTANTITYATVGEVMKYWEFFPLEREGWGLVPAWGYAIVTESKGSLKIGDRYYGFWPIASSVNVLPDRVRESGFVDCSPHRVALPSIYNNYSISPVEDSDDLCALLQPLLAISYFIDDFLSENAFFDAEQIIIASASSKTGLGLARYLANRRPDGPAVVGLTGAKNLSFCERLGYYDQVISYNQLSNAVTRCPSVYVDMSGNAAIRHELHSLLNKQLHYSCAVGLSHWDQFGSDKDLPGAKPKMFFAPSWAEKRRADWGPSVLATRLDASWRDVAQDSIDWLSIVHHQSLNSVPAVWENLVSGNIGPETGQVAVLKQ